MNRLVVSVLALAWLAAAPADPGLIAGTVRDQHGVPIAGARVQAYAGAQRLARATTASDGTFAILDAHADEVEIECKFCVRARLRVGADGTVVAIVHRYDAVRSEVPTGDDLARLPYADVESALSLTPFVLRSQSAVSIEGPHLDDRRVSGHGGLLLLNGVANYDIESNASPYSTIPNYDASSIALRRSQDAYLYGDTADAGTFVVDTTGGSQLIAVGAGGAVKAALGSGTLESTAATSSTLGDDMRSRADARADFRTSTLAGSASVGLGRGLQDLPGDWGYGSSFSSARLAAERTSGADIAAVLSADRGTYWYDSPKYPADVVWSDVDARASIRARSAFSPFALVDLRRSVGETRLGQTRLVTGATYDEPQFSFTAALGTDAVSYDSYDATTSSPASAHDGVFSATWRPSDTVSLEASTRSGYTLPVFAVAYDAIPGAPITIDQNNALESTLSVSDAHRLSVSLTALRFQDTAGTKSGSAGVSIAWQVSPKISLRTWTLRDADTQFTPASFGSTWATYQNGDFSIDVILRRDLRDGMPDPHFDGSINGALGRQASWFLATERPNGVRTLRLGLRF